MDKGAAIALVLVVSVVVLVGYVYVNKIEAGPPPDKYIFIQLEENISGAPGAIDRPRPYSFDETSGILQCTNSFEISDNLVAVFGERIRLTGPGGGAIGGALPIYATPSSLGTLVISSEVLSVESDGTIHLNCDNIRIALKPGEEWENEFTKEWMGDQVNCIITIKNHGLQDKDKISFGE
jgi:hypothetical protein